MLTYEKNKKYTLSKKFLSKGMKHYGYVSNDTLFEEMIQNCGLFHRFHTEVS
jgi:hypothetical protein